MSSANARRSAGEDILRNVHNMFYSLNNKLEKNVVQHLRMVYGTLCVGLLAASVGAILQVLTGIVSGSLLLALASIGFMVALSLTPHSPENDRKRFGYFVAFAGLSGLSTGPLIEHAIEIDPSILLTAFLATAIVFGCFTMAALHAPSTKYLHLGGMISSALLFVMFTVMFSRSVFIHTLCLWVTFGINCALVLYDTQLICEKRRRGDTDYIWHSIELFIDFVNLFRFILTILKDKQEKRKRS